MYHISFTGICTGKFSNLSTLSNLSRRRDSFQVSIGFSTLVDTCLLTSSVCYLLQIELAQAGVNCELELRLLPLLAATATLLHCCCCCSATELLCCGCPPAAAAADRRHSLTFPSFLPTPDKGHRRQLGPITFCKKFSAKQPSQGCCHPFGPLLNCIFVLSFYYSCHVQFFKQKLILDMQFF